MKNNVFITVTGVSHYYGMKPFEIDRVIKLVKEPDNEYDSEAIRVELPFIDKIGYVANSPNTIAKGTVSAGRIFDLFEGECFAQVLFVTHASVICGILTEENATCEPIVEQPIDEQHVERKIKNEFNKPKYPIGFKV